MSRDLGTLADIVVAARLALAYLADRQEADFLEDWLVQDAVIRRLEIFGEAARRLSDQTRQQLPAVPWGALIGAQPLDSPIR